MNHHYYSSGLEINGRLQYCKQLIQSLQEKLKKLEAGRQIKEGVVAYERKATKVNVMLLHLCLQ